MRSPSPWLVLALSLPGLPSAACRPPQPIITVAESAPIELVAAHSTGLLSRRAPIRVRLVSEAVPDEKVGQPVDAPIFHFEPAISGTATWTSRQEITFTPSQELTPGQRYTATFDLPKLLPGKPEAVRFRFQFAAITPAYEREAFGLEAEDDEGLTQRYRGRLKLADVADDAAVERMLTARHGDDPLQVSWLHGDDDFIHVYTITGIRRQERATTLTLALDGAPIGADQADMATVAVPGLNQFVVSTVRAVTDGERHIEIRFSDPLATRQDLRGLVTVEGRDDVRLERDGSVVRLYAASPWSGTETVRITGVKNARGQALLDARVETVSFEPIKPQVRFVGQSVILPTSADLTVPLEVVNLRAVTVEATRVYERNVPQFLQVNALGGDAQLERVGKVVWRDRVEIPASPDQDNRWVRVGLDVSRLIAAEPTGLYRLDVRFSRRDIQWACAEPAWEDADPAPAAPWDRSGGEQSFWDLWGGSDGDDGGWRWNDRENPCKRRYYSRTDWDDHGQSDSRNVLVTDIGLIARQGAGGAIQATATNLRTAAPLAGATLELLDYQLQPLATGTTNAEGAAKLESPDEHPFALVAHANGQSSWLRLDRGSSLAVSHFDVSGAEVHEGLKGVIYGERGVWRPGDPLHLSFVLFDAAGRVPASHPIEFQLRNPMNQVVDSRKIPTSIDGFYAIPTRTEPDAPTGRYTAVVRAGGAVFSKTLRVETVVPNRLKIELPVPKSGVRVSGGEGGLAFESVLASRWLHGALAPGFKADIQLLLATRPTTFSRYADYQFDDPSQRFSAEPQELWEGVLDAEGKAKVDASFETPPSPGLLTATLRTRVFEPSGAASVDEVSVPVSPYSRYVGIALPKGDAARGMLLTDIDQKVKIVAVDADGKPTGSGTVKMSIRKLRWRWWWEQGDDNLTEYAGRESGTPIREGELTLKNGVGSWAFQINYPDWGRYLVTATDTESGHTTGKIVYIDWPGWAGRAQKDQPGGASVLSLTADKDKVEVGQPVTLSFPMPRGARAMVSLESGSRVIKTDWVTPSSDSDTGRYVVETTAEMAPTIYAHVTVIQPHQTVANDAPMRLYGIVPLGVFDPATRLKPVISTAKALAPDTTALVSVSESSGRAMTYTLAVVDEGLLGLTRHKTTDPWDTFYAREALGVRTWDLYDWVAGAYGGTLEHLLSIGGDGEAELNKRPKAQRFKPVVWYGGPYTLDAGQTDRREVPIPQYIGEVRVMVVAGKGAAFGVAEASVPVKAPLMALATLPRVLGPQEEVELPVSVFALEPRVKDVTVTVTVEGPLSVDKAQRTLRFGAPGEEMTTFRLKVGEELGIARVHVKAAGAGETASQDIEIDVRHPGAPVSRVVEATLAAGKTWSQDVAFVGMAGTNTVSLEVSRMPPLALGRRLDDLIQYPHGCIEQTTSAAFPQVHLSRLLDLTPGEAEATSRNVKAALLRLRSFQNGDGGFGYWPGQPSHDWGSSYAGNFLVEAERAGFPLPSGMRAAWIRYQRDVANRWNPHEHGRDLDQAYRLYTLALAGNPEIGAMNRLRERTLSTPGRWRLAAAYALAGQKAAAAELMSKADVVVAEYRELSGTFGSALRDRALILEAMVLTGELSRASALATEISAALDRPAYLSTQETAQALAAMARFGDASGGPGETRFSWSHAGGSPAQVASQKPMARLPVSVGKATHGSFSVQSGSSGTLFLRLVSRGLPALATEEATASGLGLDVRYVSLSGAELPFVSLEQGVDLWAKVTVHNTSGRALEELALTQIFPSGWEIGGLSPGKGPGFEYRDVRDDRVYTYFDLPAGGKLEAGVPLNASYIGQYYLPPVSVEAMYDPSIQARIAGGWVSVVKQNID